MVLLAAVHVDRLVVDQQRRGGAVDLADDARLRPLLDDHEVVDRRRAQADALGREHLRHPVIAPAGFHEHAFARQQVEQFRGVPPEVAAGISGACRYVAFVERQLERRALHVADAYQQVVRVDEPRLRRRVEEVVGVRRHVLAERRRRRHDRRERQVVAATRAPHLLPRARERARIARQHRRIQPADIDAQLQRVRRHDAADAALAQPALDCTPLVRQIAAAVALDGRRADVGARCAPGRRLQRFAQVAQQQLDAHARRREHDRLHACLQQPRADDARGVHRALANAQLAVHDRRVVDRDDLPPARRAVIVDQRHGPADDVPRQLGRVGDGGRAANEDRVGAVEAADAVQPPDDVRHVAAEDAAILVQLVDDDVAEVLEQLHPLRVVRQDARVQHVRVRDDDVARLAHLATRIARRVAVVRERADIDAQVRDEAVQLLHLVLRQRLCREEVEARASGSSRIVWTTGRL